jgi:AraC-like DNA-binding protein
MLASGAIRILRSSGSRAESSLSMSGRVQLDERAAPLDRVVFRTAAVTIAAFRCPTSHPLFSDSGPIQNDVFVFPRQHVELCHEGGQPFVADANVVTLYNRGQRYRRRALAPQGDECDWFAVDRALLLDIVRTFDPRIDDRPDAPFRYSHAPCQAETYRAQRELFERSSRGEASDPLFVEEAVASLLADVLTTTYRHWDAPASPRQSERRPRDCVACTRLLLSERLTEPLKLREIAREVGSSVFHLCRAFRAATGFTLHGYRNHLRLRHALERVADGEDLTRLALDLGFSSHSHFSAAFRGLFGVTPSAMRARLAAGSFDPERHHRVHVPGAASGKIRGEKTDAAHRRADGGRGHGVERRHLEKECRDEARQDE